MYDKIQHFIITHDLPMRKRDAGHRTWLLRNDMDENAEAG